MAAILHRGVHPDEEFTPEKFPVGPEGHRGGQAWPGTLGGITMFPEIIIGPRPLAAFDVFVAEWLRLGGDVLTREANEMFEIKRAFRARLAALAPP